MHPVAVGFMEAVINFLEFGLRATAIPFEMDRRCSLFPNCGRFSSGSQTERINQIASLTQNETTYPPPSNYTSKVPGYKFCNLLQG
jgi:hypothetical protein